MSTRRLKTIAPVPLTIKKVFKGADDPATSEERLWRERAARMTLDALGYTNLTVKPIKHNWAVRYARRWFRQLFADHPDPKQVDNAEATFDAAGILFRDVCRETLAFEPLLFPDPKIDEDDE